MMFNRLILLNAFLTFLLLLRQTFVVVVVVVAVVTQLQKEQQLNRRSPAEQHSAESFSDLRS